MSLGPSHSRPSNSVQLVVPKTAKTTETVLKARKPRSNILRACKTCRLKKVKCDGNTPCKTCVRDRFKCVYLYNDRRWQRERDALVSHFEEKIHVYEVLLRVMKLGNEEQAQSALRALRGTSNIADQIDLSDPSLAKFLNDFSSEELQPVYQRTRTLSIDHMSLRSSPNELPVFACDPYNTEPDDPLSKTILTFRDMARLDIQRNNNMSVVIGSRTPNLELFFRPRRPNDPYTTWSWACELAKAYPLPLTVQLLSVYIAGILMRFHIHPCEETFNDLPHWLQPTKRQYTEPHAAGIDFCALPPLKDYMFSNWDLYAALWKAGHVPNWPYSDEACFSTIGQSNIPTFSSAFLEHVSDIRNHSVGPQILETVPTMAPYVRLQSLHSESVKSQHSTFIQSVMDTTDLHII